MEPSVKQPRTNQPGAPEDTSDHIPLLKAGEAVADTAAAGQTAPPAVEAGQQPDPADPASLVGQRFGDFEVLAELGRGGMGVVYKARQVSLDRLVALKVLLSDPSVNSTVRGRFLAEARAGAALVHPNIPTIYQTGECPAGPYCAMEFIDGQTLDTIIQGRTVSIASAVGLLFRVAGAVHHAHTKGIIHRDLKPGNIMLDRKNRPVVMDFGLAKLLEKPTFLTLEGDIVGTPTYMPPEQARGNVSQIGPRCDVYSLGAILYRLLAGRPPYGEQAAFDTLMKLLSAEPPPPLRHLRPEVPAALEQVCMKCLRKDPAGRYPTANALAVALRPFRTAPPEQKKNGSATMRPLRLQGTLEMTWTQGQVPLTAGAIVIGRASGCDLELPALTVSERHCRILVDPHRQVVEAEDLGSVAGTCVNGRSVKRCRLQDGDRLDVGGFLFRVRLQKPPAPAGSPKKG